LSVEVTQKSAPDSDVSHIFKWRWRKADAALIQFCLDVVPLDWLSWIALVAGMFQASAAGAGTRA